MGTMYIIGGCNGAGKTTISHWLLPELKQCREVVNADIIAQTLSPNEPEQAAFQAGKKALRRIDELIGDGVDFGVETTLAGKAHLDMLYRAKLSGYRVMLLFIVLGSETLACERVRSRYRLGGHFVPEEDIKRRYRRGLENLSAYLPLCDEWIIADNSSSPREIAAYKRNCFQLFDQNVWDQLGVCRDRAEETRSTWNSQESVVEKIRELLPKIILKFYEHEAEKGNSVVVGLGGKIVKIPASAMLDLIRGERKRAPWNAEPFNRLLLEDLNLFFHRKDGEGKGRY